MDQNNGVSLMHLSMLADDNSLLLYEAKNEAQHQLAVCSHCAFYGTGSWFVVISVFFAMWLLQPRIDLPLILLQCS